METFTGFGFMLGPPLGGVLYTVSVFAVRGVCNVHKVGMGNIYSTVANFH